MDCPRALYTPMTASTAESQTVSPPVLVAATPRRLTGTHRVWLFSAMLAAIALAIYLLVIRTIPPLAAPFEIPWWILAALFFVAEVKVVHFHFRRDAHSFSLSEIPLVLGLFFVSPRWFLLAYLVGAGAALRFHRHQSMLKLAFNLSQFWLGGAVALAIVHGVGLFRGEPGPIEWAATLLAVIASNTIGAVAVAMAISLSEGGPSVRHLTATLKLSTVVAATNASLALLAVTVLWHNPQAAWLFGIPVTTLFLAYQAYVSEREKSDNLALLYESSRILQRTPELDTAIVALLGHTASTFRAEHAQLLLWAGSGETEGLRTVVGPADQVELMTPFALDPEHSVLRRIQQNPGAALLSGGEASGLETSSGPIRDAMICPLLSESGTMGALIVANRRSDVSTFGPEDLRLLETIANHAAAALANGRLERSLSELTNLKEELRHQADHDPLTGLANRALFGQAVDARLQAVDLAEPGPDVLFLDLDDFKLVNDSLGHAAGDQLLVEVAGRLQDCLRSHDLAARLGGDEFAILLAEAGQEHSAEIVVDRIMASLRAPFMLFGKPLVISVSVGIATAGGSPISADELLRNADVAMYSAKARGKNGFAIFEPAMHHAVVERSELGHDLREAVARKDLQLVYQPIFDLRNGRPVGVEALVRWQRPGRGLVMPNAFIKVAEETGIILEIGGWVLLEACRQAELWSRTSPTSERPFITVNVSSRQIQHPGFVGDLHDALLRSGLPPEQLVLEITETAFLEDTEATIAKLNTIVSYGVRVAVDDFGTGYSSLSYLHRFPVSMLKIAHQFVDRLDRDLEGMAFARAIIALAQALGMTVIAEGIERTDQLDRLNDLACEYGQGYLFARPLDADTTTRLLESAAPIHGSSDRPSPSRGRFVAPSHLQPSGPLPH